MRKANKAIKRVRYLIPTVDEISQELNGAKFFSKLDLAQAYHQLELDEKCRFITTFSTHIIIFGKTRNDHDQALLYCLRRLSDNGLTLNAAKCKFLTPSLSFFGQIFSAKGTQPDPARISDLQNAQTPQNVHEVRSFLGMTNYSSRYIPDYATITEPLRALTKKDVRFRWTAPQQEAFDQLKIAVTHAPVMHYFDTTKETTLTVDASPVGISAILSQKDDRSNDSHTIAYVSRALTQVEQRYSN